MTRRSLLLGTTGTVLLGIVVFALPLIVTAVVLAVTMLLSPAVWTVGSSYAANGGQAFFRGGLIAGIVPFVAASIAAFVLCMGGFFSPTYSPQVRVFSSTGVTVATAAPAVASEVAPSSDTTIDESYPPILNSAPGSAIQNPIPDPISVPTVVVPAPAPVVAIEHRSPLSSVPPQSYADMLPMRITMAILWLAPGVFAFLGGTLGYVTQCLVKPRQDASAAAALRYCVTSGRVKMREAEAL